MLVTEPLQPTSSCSQEDGLPFLTEPATAVSLVPSAACPPSLNFTLQGNLPLRLGLWIPPALALLSCCLYNQLLCPGQFPQPLWQSVPLLVNPQKFLELGYQRPAPVMDAR